LEETRLRMTPTRISEPAPEAYAVLLKSSVTTNKNGKPNMIGRIGIPRQDENVAEIGYGFHPDYWGKGYATEAIRLLIEVYWAPGSMLLPLIEPKTYGSIIH
jgi:RimJ/RimL family protein N-acetyltransferase